MKKFGGYEPGTRKIAHRPDMRSMTRRYIPSSDVGFTDSSLPAMQPKVRICSLIGSLGMRLSTGLMLKLIRPVVGSLGSRLQVMPSRVGCRDQFSLPLFDRKHIANSKTTRFSGDRLMMYALRCTLLRGVPASVKTEEIETANGRGNFCRRYWGRSVRITNIAAVAHMVIVTTSTGGNTENAAHQPIIQAVSKATPGSHTISSQWSTRKSSSLKKDRPTPRLYYVL